MGKADKLHTKGAEVDFLPGFHDMQFNLIGDPFFFELPPNQCRCKRIGVKRHTEIGCEIRHRADMILMPVRQDDTDKILLARFDKFQIGEDQINAGIIRTGKCQAEIDHQPFAITAIKVNVHADFVRPAKREKE